MIKNNRAATLQLSSSLRILLMDWLTISFFLLLRNLWGQVWLFFFCITYIKSFCLRQKVTNLTKISSLLNFFLYLFLFIIFNMADVPNYLFLHLCEAYKSVLFIHSVSIHIDDSNLIWCHIFSARNSKTATLPLIFF